MANKFILEKLRTIVCILQSDIDAINHELSIECHKNDAFDNIDWYDNDAFDNGPVVPETYKMVCSMDKQEKEKEKEKKEEEEKDEVIVWNPSSICNPSICNNVVCVE